MDVDVTAVDIDMRGTDWVMLTSVVTDISGLGRDPLADTQELIHEVTGEGPHCWQLVELDETFEWQCCCGASLGLMDGRREVTGGVHP